MYNRKNVIHAKDLRKNMTPWERKLWYNFLKTYPVRFYRQREIGSYIADFYCSAAKLVIELDGGGHFTDEQREKDNIRTGFLEKCGLSVMRISNDEVWYNFDGVCEAIELKIKEQLQNNSDFSDKSL